MNGLVKGKEVHFDDEYLHVKLEDGRIITILKVDNLIRREEIVPQRD